LCIKFTEGKGPLGRPRHRCEDNVKMDHKEIGWWVGGIWVLYFSIYFYLDWGNLAQDRNKCWEVLGCCEHGY